MISASFIPPDVRQEIRASFQVCCPKCLDCLFSKRREPGSPRAEAAGKSVPAKLSLALPSAANVPVRDEPEGS